MRKILTLLLSMAAVLTVTACSDLKTGQDKDPVSSFYYSMDEFLEKWYLEDDGTGDSADPSDDGDEPQSVTVPVLKNSRYIFYFAEKNEYAYMFFYVPENFSAPSFDYERGIVVYMFRESESFSAVMDQHGLVAVDGMAYDESNNEWYMDINGKSLSVLFPKSVPVTTKEELYSYFDFEEYTAPNGSDEPK